MRHNSQERRKLRMTEHDDDAWLRPLWQDEPAGEGLDPPGLPPLARPHDTSTLDAFALLAPLAEASAALARLDARLEAADPAVAAGLRARLALREAAGWLAHQEGTWVHPVDLGLRAASLTGSITVAAMGRTAARHLAHNGAHNGGCRPVAGRAGRRPRRRSGVANRPALAPPGRAPQLDPARRCRVAAAVAPLRWYSTRCASETLTSSAQLGCHEPAEDAMAAWLPYAGIPLAARAKP